MDVNNKENIGLGRVGRSDYSRYRLMLVSALIIFSCLVGFALWTGYESQNQLRNTARNLFAGESAKRAMAVGFFFSKRVSELENLADNDAVKRFMSTSDKLLAEPAAPSSKQLEQTCKSLSDTLAEEFTGAEQVFSRLALVDSRGRMLIDTDNECILLRDYGGFDKYSALGGRPEFMTGDSGGVMDFAVSVPVYGPTGNIGSVVGWVRVESLHRSLSILSSAPSVGSDFLRVGDTIVAISDVSARKSGELLLMDALREWRGLTILKTGDGGSELNYLAISSPVHGTSMSIISLVQEKVIFGPLGIKAHLLISLTVFVAVALGCYYLVLTIFKRQIYETKVHEAGMREAAINTQKDKLEKEVQKRRLAEALRKRAEIRYRDIFDNAPLGIFQATIDGRYLTANTALAKIFGYEDQQELITMIRNVRTDVYVTPEEWDTGIALLRSRGEVSGYEVECRRKDGSTVWTSRDFRLVEGDSGFPSYLEGFVIDITARRVAEQEIDNSQKRLRSLFENSPVALWEMDLSRVREAFDARGGVLLKLIREEMLNTREDVRTCVGMIDILDSNRLAKDFLNGRNRSSEKIGSLSGYVTERSWRFFRIVLLDFASGKTRNRSELRLLREDGSEQFLIINCSIVPGFEKSWKRVLATVEDMSELKRIEKELRISREQAQKANEAKGHFLANMSHEFRTPMNAIKGMVQLLQKSQLNEEQHENLHLIKSSVDSLLVIVNDILDYSKMESMHMELSEDNLELYSFLKELRDVMDFDAINKKIEVTLEAEGIPACVRVDSLRLRQILTNLLGNAIKFTNQGRVVLRCSTVAGKSNGKTMLRFEVADTGIGLPEGKVESLFKSFVQADPTITRKYGGTGLGLAISYRLVKLLGGELAAENNADGGATFSFTIPLHKCSTDIQELPVAEQHEEEVTDLSKIRVLVAEDSRMNQILLRKIFEKNGVEDYLIVENGKDCVDAFADSGDYDIIFMDIQMPVMDGFEAAEIIRRQHNPVRIVALTANEGDDFKKQCLEAGMNARIVKPFNVDDLLRELSHVASVK